MLRWQTIAGVIVGILAGGTILALIHEPPRRETGPVLPESSGRIRELVLHYEPQARGIVATAYREFLAQLDQDVTVHVVCPDAAAFDDFQKLVGSTACRVSSIVTKHPITTWSRDRWVPSMPTTPGGTTTLWMPRAEAASELWPARAGDERVGEDIAACLRPSVRAQRSELYFDGGDFLADEKNVFVTPRVLQRNLQHTVGTRDELLNILGRQFQRRVVLLNESPDHHAGMFMASLGDTMLVGDPQLGRRFVEGSSTGDWDFSDATQRLFDSVAQQCANLGYKVVRIPIVPGQNGRTYLTHVNVILESTPQRRGVYLPRYRGFTALNEAAAQVWTQLGYEVRTVDCSDVYPHFGSLHCLVNVLRRS